jgi:outer membrane protein OmpA-like peptidoglycan-associated protein/tetratricopeptide (TPR) repeat protein
MKKHFLLILTALSCYTWQAWGGNIAGDIQFSQHNYAGAIEAYSESISPEDSAQNCSKQAAYAKYKIGECHAYLNQPNEAVSFLNDALLSGYQEAEAYLIYGKNLQKLGEYKRAKAAFEEYERLRPTDPRTKNLKLSCDFALRHQSLNPISPEQRLNGISSPNMEYGIGFYKNGIIYASTYAGKKGIQSAMYYSDANDDYQSSKPITNMVSMRNPNLGTFAVDTVSNTLYYSRCINNENNDCYIYYSIYQKDKWKNKGILPIGDRYTDASHPALSADGQRLYFTSNREGGMGGSDIWYICKKQNGKWDFTPINAGAVVNTAGNEAFPYVVENTLVFASDGHVGFGGYDLYSAQIDGASISDVRNLYRPINSSYDDINLILSKAKDEAYLVSSRQRETNDDIYAFKGVFSSTLISGHIYDKKTELPLADAQVIINGKNSSQTVQSDANGYYYAFVEAGDYHKLLVSSKGYLSDIAMVKTEKTIIGSFPVEQDFYLSQTAMSISGRVYDMETNEPFINEDVMLISNGEVIQQTKTDITGRYTFTDLENGKEYQVKVNKPNFLSISSKPFVYSDQSNQNTLFDLASIASDLTSEAGANGANGTNGGANGKREVQLRDIYYNFDSAKLLPDSKASLNRIVMLMESNPTLKLEFGSHTDSRGTFEYNDELSWQRAKSVVDYLVQAGIAKDRLSWKGYGKRYPLIKNAATEGEHRLNRRTTFIITEQ